MQEHLLDKNKRTACANAVPIGGGRGLRKGQTCFKERLEDLLSAVPDTLTVNEVAELTGYHRKTILRYVQRKYMYAVNIMGKYYISKHSIINYLATDKAFKNTQKSEWHRMIIQIFAENSVIKVI